MSYTTFSIIVMVLLLVSGAWLASRGHKVGFFFALVAVLALASYLPPHLLAAVQQAIAPAKKGGAL
jgi:hypothetical protein